MLESQNEYMAKYITLENIPSKVGSRKEKKIKTVLTSVSVDLT